MVLSFDLSLRGAGVSSLLIVLAVNVIVTPQLLKSWEQGMLRDDPRRQLQASRPETPYPCVKTVSCDQPVDWDGAVAACAEVGAAVCELAQFEDAGAVLAGCTDSENPREVYTALVESDQCPNPNERLVITNACTDWGNDCCIAKDGDVAQCTAGYDVVQLQGGGDCYDPDLFRPTFECVPRVPVAEPNCVATSTRANRAVCCAAQACMENGGRDNDCCTMQGGGGCLGGCAFAPHWPLPLALALLGSADAAAAVVRTMASVPFRYLCGEIGHRCDPRRRRVPASRPKQPRDEPCWHSLRPKHRHRDGCTAERHLLH